MCAWHTNVGAGGQKKDSDALELVGTRELPDLGAGCSSSERAASTLNH